MVSSAAAAAAYNIGYNKGYKHVIYNQDIIDYNQISINNNIHQYDVNYQLSLIQLLNIVNDNQKILLKDENLSIIQENTKKNIDKQFLNCKIVFIGICEDENNVITIILDY